jgi:DNA repair protein RAD16
VYIPKKDIAPITSRGKQPESTAPSSVADSVDSLSSYETPGTSTVPTPDPVTSKAKVSATARALQLQSSKFALGGQSRASRKRKNADDEDYENSDAKIAAKLQEEEYNMVVDSEDTDEPPLSKRPRTARTYAASDDATDTDEDIPLASTRRPNTRLPIHATKPAPAAPRAGVSLEDSELSSVADSEMQDFIDSSVSDAGTQDFIDSALSSVSADDGDDADDDPLSAPPSRFAGARSTIKRRRGRSFHSIQWDHLTEEEKLDYFDPQRRRQIRERKKLERAHPEIKTMWSELEKEPRIIPVQAPQPSGITRKLKPFQLEGLDWMMKQEKSKWAGGLLGDEMGMGKTIQAVSLIMSDYPAKAPSLVVVPPVALMQWQSEMKEYTDGKLKVLIYHISANPKCKSMKSKDLKQYDVIMVSYSGLESMYRKEEKGWSRGGGLVKEDSLLHSIKFHRLILDEAHSIKSRTTGVARACFALKANYKWCLSGTPVQNRIGEFFSLLRFLEIKPFSCYFCKACKCHQLHWSQDESKRCTSCKHSGFNHVSVFNQEILNPITQAENKQLRQAGLDKLRLITDRIMLRRMKKDHTSSMELPPKEIVIHNEFFGEIERDFSQSIMSNSTRKFDTYVAQGVMLNNYANIFGLIMQMRQVANHPDLILRKNAEGGQNVLVCSICDEPAEEAIRSRCHHEFCRQCAKSYVQSFAGSINGSTEADADCPRCHIPLVIDWDQPEIEQDEDKVKKSSIINRIKMEDWTSSTKIEMLVYDLYKLRSKKQTHKSIVFSQFTSMLQLVQWRLQKSGFSTVLLDGSMTPAQRQKSIEHFMNNVDVEVFLVSLKAGGVALNLTEASRVFIIDP